MEQAELELMAKYPFIPPVHDFIKSKNIKIAELKADDLYVKRAQERIEEAIKDGVVSVQLGDLETEILSFTIALGLVKATGRDDIQQRWVYAESVRFERLLALEKKSTAVQVFWTAIVKELI